MTKVINCKDLGFDCDAVVRAESTEEALNMVAGHAKQVHDMDTVSPELVDRVKRVMREE